MLGLQFIGPLVKVDHPDFDPGSGERQAFSNVTLQGHRYDGEPFWMKAAFNRLRQDGKPTRLAEQLDGLEVGTLCALEVEAATTKRGGIWYRAKAIEAVNVAAKTNGKPAAAAPAAK